jgi:limonene-1,2-epoxide hydrolase
MTPAETVTAFIAAIERKDIDAALALAAVDISYENMPFSPIVGHEGVAQTLDAFLAPASEVDWQILNQHEVGATVFNERLDRFRIGEGWLELPIAGVFHVDDNGLITLWRDYFDMATYERQLTELTKPS